MECPTRIAEKTETEQLVIKLKILLQVHPEWKWLASNCKINLNCALNCLIVKSIKSITINVCKLFIGFNNIKLKNSVSTYKCVNVCVFWG